MAALKPSIVSLTESELDALIKRLEDAIEYNLSLSPEDIRLVLDALLTLAHVQEQLADNKITLYKLRKLVGIVRASEKLRHLDLPQDPAANDSDNTPCGRSSRPKQPVAKKPKQPKNNRQDQPHQVLWHRIEALQAGDACSECSLGRLYKYQPARLFQVSGQSPFQVTCHLCERLRCNACGILITAPLPKVVACQGDLKSEYAYSARSLMAINKYFMGSPFYRQQSLQQLFHIPISASTVFDQCQKLAGDLDPVFQLLRLLAANAAQLDIDDTNHRILSQTHIRKKKRNSNDWQVRTGTYTSVLRATTSDDHVITLFQTNIGHSGEWVDEILSHRTSGLSPPIIMSDALSCNKVTTCEAIHTLCNSHARRQFVDIKAQFPEAVTPMLQLYGLIWHYEKLAQAQQLDSEQRLLFHRKHSFPILLALRRWGRRQLRSGAIEANSGLGKAWRYFDRHFVGLTQFCRVADAKLDNNLTEQEIKVVARGRKNAYFYKTTTGAAVSDTITSLIATGIAAGINVFDYFNAIQQYRTLVRAHPSEWMPWNFQKNCKILPLNTATQHHRKLTLVEEHRSEHLNSVQCY